MKLTLKTAYILERRKGRRAVDAIAAARPKVGDDVCAYYPNIWQGLYPPFGNFGPPFAAFGENHMRWIENPARAGLRFENTAQDACEWIRYNGWYVDDDCHETVHGVVYRMSARDGAERFVAGYADPWNDGPACLSFDEIFDDASEAARRADGIAERMAESEREYRCKTENENRAAEIPDEIRADLEAARLTLRELRTLPGVKPSSSTHPCMASTAWREIERLRDNAAGLRTKLAELTADPLHGFQG